MKEKYLPNKKYYEFSTNCVCGVIVNEKIMKKIQKVLYKAEHEIKNILHNSEDVRPYLWSLVNIKDGDKILKQKVFHYAKYIQDEYDNYDSTENRINRLKLTTPRYMEDFYEIKSDGELEDLKMCLLEEMQEELEYGNA